jgi:hypothetical protein
MSIALTIVAVALTALLGVIGRLYLRARALSPAVYRNLGLGDLQPFLRSWGIWLGDRANILIGHERATGTVQFRKHVYKGRANTLVFRYRNADDSRAGFPAVRTALDRANVDYELELTKRTRRPRAVAVTLNARDVLTPAAAIRLVDTAFGALGASTPEFFVWCEGRLQAAPDSDGIALIPHIAARRAGFRIGVVVGRLWRSVGMWRT